MRDVMVDVEMDLMMSLQLVYGGMVDDGSGG